MQYFYRSKITGRLKECEKWEVALFDQYGYHVQGFDGKKVLTRDEII